MGLTNNDVFKKLRVAHKLRDDDIVNPKYVECGDQFLRNFLDGLIIHLRGPMPPKKPAKAKGKPEKS